MLSTKWPGSSWNLTNTESYKLALTTGLSVQMGEREIFSLKCSANVLVVQLRHTQLLPKFLQYECICSILDKNNLLQVQQQLT